MAHVVGPNLPTGFWCQIFKCSRGPGGPKGGSLLLLGKGRDSQSRWCHIWMARGWFTHNTSPPGAGEGGGRATLPGAATRMRWGSLKAAGRGKGRGSETSASLHCVGHIQAAPRPGATPGQLPQLGPSGFKRCGDGTCPRGPQPRSRPRIGPTRPRLRGRGAQAALTWSPVPPSPDMAS